MFFFSGNIWVKPKDQPKFEVHCKKGTNQTCLIIKPIGDSKKHAINYKNEERSFWLSQKGFNIRDFYNGVSTYFHR